MNRIENFLMSGRNTAPLFNYKGDGIYVISKIQSINLTTIGDDERDKIFDSLIDNEDSFSYKNRKEIKVVIDYFRYEY